MAPDKRALKILSGMFWSSAGWKRDPKVSPEDFAYAKAKGVMFEPVALTHDQAVVAAIDAVSRTGLAAVSRAFVSSLGSRRLDLRSALGSFAVARHMKAHPKIASGVSPGCRYCGGYDRADADLNILNFERLKWGGVRHDHPQYIAFDLGIFATLDGIMPSREDYLILRSIFEAAKFLPSTARLSDLERALSNVLPSNNGERRALIGILGYAGILVDPGRPDFRSKFVSCADREETPWSKDDWPYPVQWWNGSCGLNQSAVDEWFPDL